MIRFLVTGAPRSGTGYTSRVLTAMGLTCGHESVYGFQPDPNAHQLLGDSSWLGLVAAEVHRRTSLRIPYTVVFQHRDPRLVASSLVHRMVHLPMSDPYQDFMLANTAVPVMFAPGDLPSIRVWVSEFVVDWMERARRVADISWSVDALTEHPRLTALPLYERVRDTGARVAPGEGGEDQVPTTVNHRGGHEPFDWSGYAVDEYAAALGYR